MATSLADVPGTNPFLTTARAEPAEDGTWRITGPGYAAEILRRSVAAKSSASVSRARSVSQRASATLR
jgi:hypothetical protein